MRFEDGPYWVQIEGAQAAIEHEKKNLKWAKERLLEEKLTHYALQLCEEYQRECEQALYEAEADLKDWMHRHFELARKLEGESA